MDNLLKLDASHNEPTDRCISGWRWFEIFWLVLNVWVAIVVFVRLVLVVITIQREPP